MGNLLKMVNNSTILGFWDEAGEWILNLLVDSTIGPLLWALCDVFFIIIDLFESLFRAFAGIKEGGVRIQGEMVEGDIVLFLMQSNLVQQIFMSIFILSLFLLIIFTILAIVKNQYADKQEPVSKIVNGSFKALFMYLLVPAATVVCLIVGNVVLQAIDGATKGTSTGASDMLFVASAYNANKLRDSDHEDNVRLLKDWYFSNKISGIEDEITRLTGLTEDDVEMATEEQIEIIALLIDERFADGTLTSVGVLDGKWNYSSVSKYYDAFRMSYITIWVGGAFLIWSIGKISWGLIARIFKMTLYYAISPAVMATFPIDNGKALGSWRGEMVKLGTSAFCAVGILNVLYSILPVFNNIDIGGGIGGSIIKLFITIIAFSSAKDLINTISGWFGTGNALADGENAKKTVTGKLTNAAINAGGAFTGFKSGYDNAKILHDGKKFKDKMARFGGGMFGGFSGSGAMAASGIDPVDIAKKIKKRGEDAGGAYQDYATTFGPNAKDNKELFELAKTQKEQTKATENLIKALEAARKVEVDRINADITLTATQKTDKIDSINEKYDKEITKAKANSDLVKPIFEAQMQALESQKQDNEKRNTNFASLRSYSQGLEQDAELQKKFVSMSGLDHATIQSNWNRIKSGDFSKVGKKSDWDNNANTLKEIYGMYASDILSNDRQIENDKNAIKSAYQSGGKKYLEGVLGTSISSTGELVGKISDIKTAIETERKGIEQEADDIVKATKDLSNARAAMFDATKDSTKKLKEEIDKAKK